MTSCVKIRTLLSALIDGELSQTQTELVNQHLEQCEACQVDWRSLKKLDAKLAQALSLDDVGEEFIRSCHSKRQVVNQNAARGLTSDTNLNMGRSRFVGLIALIAAAILVCASALVYSFKTKVVSGPDPSPGIQPQIVARLVRATGAVELQLPGSVQWDSVNNADETPLAQGSRLRTGESVLCEIETSDHAKIRLNETGEVVFHDSRAIELIQGQLWCLASDQSGIEIDLAINGPSVPKIASFLCPSESEFQCSAADNSASCDSISLLNTQTEMSFGASVCSIKPGETVSIDAEQQVQRKPSDDQETKVWQLPLLAIGNEIDQELRTTMTKLLAPIGMTKATHLNEVQIRRLGPPGAIPLLAYALTETSPERLDLRRRAVLLASELADQRAIGLLTRLTEDPDTVIADQAARTLQRIASESR